MVINSSGFGDIREVSIKHNDKEYSFNVSGYAKQVFNPTDADDVEIDKHINQYWATLPQAKQEKIFECFGAIRRVFDTTFDTIPLTNELLIPIKNLYNEHQVEDLEQWLIWKSDVIIPSKNSAGKVIFEEVYHDSDMRAGTRVQTYTRNDYIGLITMALMLRMMIPIWGEFMYRIRSTVGTNYKEMHSVHLLSKTDLLSHPYMKRLENYINSNIKIDDSMFGAIISGIGTEDYPRWLISLVLVRRLCIGNFSGSNPDISLVTFIYNYIKQKMGTNGTSAWGGDIVRDKFKFYDDNGKDDDNLSRTESYKIRQAVPTGETVAIDFYLSDPYTVAKHLDPTIPKELIDACIATCSIFNNNIISKVQVTLTQWVMAKVVSPRAFPQLSKAKVINAIAICQAWLWHKGHKELSCLVSAITSDNSSVMQLGGIDSRSRITKDQMEIINQLYPFTTVRSSKQKTKPSNDAVTAIDAVATELSFRDWILTAQTDKVVQITGDSNITRYSTPYDIKIKLAALVIDLNADTIEALDKTSI